MDPLERAFIAIPVADQTREALKRINHRVRTIAPRLSCPHPDHAHITFTFLGAVDGEAAERIAAGLDAVCARHKPFTVMVGGGGYFGSPRNPRVIWVGMPPVPALMALQADVAAVVNEAGIPLEKRPFKPHLTIARNRAPLPPGSLTSIITFINNTHFAEILVDRVLLLNSRLHGPGPRYTTVHQSLL